MSSSCENQEISLADLDYELPEELIAQEPLSERHNARLMVLRRTDQAIEHRTFLELPRLLRRGDVVIVNDTKVLPARVFARRASGGLVKILLIRPEPEQQNLWEAMATPMRRLKAGEKLTLEKAPGNSPDDLEGLELVVNDVTTDADGYKRLIIDMGDNRSLRRILEKAGRAPLPPYIHREAQASDLSRYQTVYAENPGAVAAPTAGLHFSRQVISSLKEEGISIQYLTLHVGPGTFKPITSSIDDHAIEEETYSIPADTAEAINQAREAGNRVVAVGTTSLRALESAVSNGRIAPAENATTGLYVRPGFQFSAVDCLITNFHLSGSSLLVLVASFAGQELTMSAYREAVAQRYRFFSYGDAMLIL